jgi:predicted TIM-barrel fold metal-dependent hydrolase
MLAAIEELGVPLHLHPTFPPKQVADVYYAGLPAAVADSLATAAWGWHAETGLHVLRMAATGVFDRHPGLKVIAGHMGENLPCSLMRADAMLHGALPGERSVADIVCEHLHITICGHATCAHRNAEQLFNCPPSDPPIAAIGQGSGNDR